MTVVSLTSLYSLYKPFVFHFQELDLATYMGSLKPPWVVSFLLRKREPYLEKLPVRFPGHLFSVMSFHDTRGEFP